MTRKSVFIGCILLLIGSLVFGMGCQNRPAPASAQEQSPLDYFAVYEQGSYRLRDIPWGASVEQAQQILADSGREMGFFRSTTPTQQVYLVTTPIQFSQPEMSGVQWLYFEQGQLSAAQLYFYTTAFATEQFPLGGSQEQPTITVDYSLLSPESDLNITFSVLTEEQLPQITETLESQLAERYPEQTVRPDGAESLLNGGYWQGGESNMFSASSMAYTPDGIPYAIVLAISGIPE